MEQFIPLDFPIALKDQNWPEGTIPLVQVRIMAFMHENFIRRCIEGVLMQRTTFPVQILIHDDASTDQTAKIIKEYAFAYPEIVIGFYQRINTFRLPNRSELRKSFFEKIIAKYECLCEGDDYWTDPEKLQLQVDILENDENISLVFHKVSTLIESGELHYKQYPIPGKTVLDLRDIMIRHYIATCSILYRNLLIDDFRITFNKKFVSGDRYIQMKAAQRGNLYYIDRDMAIHLKHAGGLTNTDLFKNRLRMAKNEFYLFDTMIKESSWKQSYVLAPKYALNAFKLGFVLLKQFNFASIRYTMIGLFWFFISPIQFIRFQKIRSNV